MEAVYVQSCKFADAKPSSIAGINGLVVRTGKRIRRALPFLLPRVSVLCYSAIPIKYISYIHICIYPLSISAYEQQYLLCVWSKYSFLFGSSKFTLLRLQNSQHATWKKAAASSGRIGRRSAVPAFNNATINASVLALLVPRFETFFFLSSIAAVCDGSLP